MLLAGLILAGCGASSAQVVKTFELAEPAGAPFSRILIVGAHKDRSIRRQFEETMVDVLRAHQADALSSITSMPSGTELNPETVGKTARETRADGVLVTRLMDVKWSTDFEAGRSTTEARRKEVGNLLDFFRYDYVEYEDPMHATAVRTVVVASDFYRVSDRTKIWSVESTAVEKENAMDVVTSIAESTRAQLQRDGLIH
jgi:hypothetical protein